MRPHGRTLVVGDGDLDLFHVRTDVEIEAMALAPIPTARILWHKPPALALEVAVLRSRL